MGHQIASLSLGAFHLIEATADILVYERRIAENRNLIALNMSSISQVIRIEHIGCEAVLSTYLDAAGGQIACNEIHLRSDEGLIVRVPSDHPTS